ncbi:hypothetical protein C4579_01290 [Candidatus Microgenomates bacterium]|nr:MAG: hypothetical protein C4579_01290 [Candidatus Microgenomates bacterium]
MSEWISRETDLNRQKNHAEFFALFGLSIGAGLFMFSIATHDLLMLHVGESGANILSIIMWVIAFGITIGCSIPVAQVWEELGQLAMEKRHIHYTNCTMHGEIVVVDREEDIGPMGPWGASGMPVLRWERTKCTECKSITVYIPGKEPHLEEDEGKF